MGLTEDDLLVNVIGFGRGKDSDTLLKYAFFVVLVLLG